jgi:hypothetical protein
MWYVVCIVALYGVQCAVYSVHTAMRDGRQAFPIYCSHCLPSSYYGAAMAVSPYSIPSIDKPHYYETVCDALAFHTE